MDNQREKNLEDSAVNSDEYITIKIKNFHKKDEHKYNEFENLAKIKQQEVNLLIFFLLVYITNTKKSF